jgi:hypothetical protein
VVSLTNIPSNGNYYILLEPHLISCMTLVTLDVRIEGLGIIFCDFLNVVHYIESDSYGFVSPIRDCAIKLRNDSNQTSNLFLSMGFYMFMKIVFDICIFFC